MVDIEKMSRREFESLPHRKWDEEIDCDSIIILPSRRLHDSGYRCMDFVAVKDNEPFCLLSDCSDVIHVDGIGGYGIGGYGYHWLGKYKTVPNTALPSGWSIDCLPKSGLLRMWPSTGRIKCGIGLASFEVFALETPI